MEFEFEEPGMMECQDAFNALPPEDRLFKTHYELASATDIRESSEWKKFLTDTRVSDWINQELTLFKSAQMRKMIKNATVQGNSVGAAQMINALNKTFDSDTGKEGATFIYTAVPLNDREQGVPNTTTLLTNIFEGGNV